MDSEREHADLQAAATELAPQLVGSSVDVAEATVADHDGLSVRFADEGSPVTMEFRYGRITATVRDGVVVAATPG